MTAAKPKPRRERVPRVPRVVWVVWDPLYGSQAVWETEKGARSDDPEWNAAHGGRVIRYVREDAPPRTRRTKGAT